MGWDGLGWGGHLMPRDDKSSYTDKPKRQASHIEEGYEKRGVSKEEAERQKIRLRQRFKEILILSV